MSDKNQLVAHTPGPWTARRSNDRWMIDGPVQGLTARWWIATAMSDEPQDEANAHLIAAAPGLLEEHRAWAQMFGEALILALQGDYSKVDKLAQAARLHFPNGSPELVSEAIAKAEGR